MGQQKKHVLANRSLRVLRRRHSLPQGLVLWPLRVRRDLRNHRRWWLHDECLKFALCPGCTTCCSAPGRRTKIRNNFALPEEPCGDCIVWVCCGGLANCQERRELAMRQCNTETDFKNVGANQGGAA